VENSEAVPSAGVGVVVCKLADAGALVADEFVGRGSDGISLQVIPVSISVRPSHMVLNESVVGMSNPETSRTRVCVEETPRSHELHHQVEIHDVLCLNSFLDEHIVTYDFITSIIGISEIMFAVEN
jgi:hypothetical protein